MSFGQLFDMRERANPLKNYRHGISDAPKSYPQNGRECIGESSAAASEGTPRRRESNARPEGRALFEIFSIDFRFFSNPPFTHLGAHGTKGE